MSLDIGDVFQLVFTDMIYFLEVVEKETESRLDTKCAVCDAPIGHIDLRNYSRLTFDLDATFNGGRGKKPPGCIRCKQAEKQSSGGRR